MLTRLFFILIACFILNGSIIPQGLTAETMPLRVRMFLIRIAPFLEKENYQKAAIEIEAFRDRGSGSQDPIYNHAEINFVLGNCRLHQGNHSAAREAYGNAVQSDPSHGSAWQNLAKAEYELENYQQAGEAFLKSYNAGEKARPELLYYAAATHLMAEAYQRSIHLFEQLLTEHAEDMQLQWRENLVHALLAVDQVERALSHIRQLAASSTGDKQQQWLEILLQQYMVLERYKQALDLALDLTRQYPTVATWWKAKAHIHLQTDDYAEALKALTIYSLLTPPNREEKRLLADLHLQLGIPVKAVPDYEDCLAEKTEAATLQRLLQAYLDLGKDETALERLQVLGKNLTDPALAMQQGDILFGLQRYDEAAEQYTEVASAQTKKSARAWLMAGYSYWQAKRFTASLGAFTEAAKNKRYRKEATQALERLKSIVESGETQAGNL